MGSPNTETGRQSDETQHEVTLTKGFYLGKYEVTQAQYEAVMSGNTDGLSATPSHYGGNPSRPVDQVSWDYIQVFLARLNEQKKDIIPNTGRMYCPPKPEYACRAGTTTVYLGGNDCFRQCQLQLGRRSDFKQTRDVGQYAANPWGFFDSAWQCLGMDCGLVWCLWQ